MQAAPFAWSVAGAALREALAEMAAQEGLDARARELCEAQFEVSAQAAVSRAVADDAEAEAREAEAAEGAAPRKRRRRRTGKIRVAPPGHKRRPRPAGTLRARVRAFKIIGDDVAFELEDARLVTRFHGTFAAPRVSLAAAAIARPKPETPRLWTAQ